MLQNTDNICGIISHGIDVKFIKSFQTDSLVALWVSWNSHKLSPFPSSLSNKNFLVQKTEHFEVLKCNKFVSYSWLNSTVSSDHDCH